MSIITQMRETVRKAWLIGDAIMNEEKVSPAEAKMRMDVCKKCEHLTVITQQCDRCGCFMRIKTKLLYDPVESDKQGVDVLTKCPVGKW